MDKFRANDILNDLSDKETEALANARDGYAYDSKDKSVEKLLQAGFVKIVNFEYVHAKNSVPGITTTSDGDKLLQELDNRPVIATREHNILDNGDIIRSTEVEVKDPNPVDNIPDSEFRPKAEKVKVGTGEAVNPGDVGTPMEREKDDDQQKADKKAAEGKRR